VWGTNDKSQEGGFTQKLLITILGFVFVASMAFFGWMASAVIDIRERVIAIESTARALAEARVVETQSDIDNNADRIERLEKAKQ
jgi:hypothetical protein